ncbi:MAG: biopolymer transporter ExbD [Gammaproteobacteria bacterium]|nr:biopolymer transporter ExbD [Gammaproteobacteria bacterium]
MISIDTEQHGGLADLAVDLTPMLDILFIVLVFFILTANPVEMALSVELPSKGAEQATPLSDKRHIQITLFANNTWGLADKKFEDRAAIEQAIKQAVSDSPNSDIVIASEKDATVEHLLALMTFLKQQNLQAAHIKMDAGSAP